MNEQIATVRGTPTSTERPASEHDERGRTNILPFIFWLMEQSALLLLAVPTVIAALVTYLAGGGLLTFVGAWLAVPVVFVLVPVLGL